MERDQDSSLLQPLSLEVWIRLEEFIDAPKLLLSVERSDVGGQSVLAHYSLPALQEVSAQALLVLRLRQILRWPCGVPADQACSRSIEQVGSAVDARRVFRSQDPSRVDRGKLRELRGRVPGAPPGASLGVGGEAEDSIRDVGRDVRDRPKIVDRRGSQPLNIGISGCDCGRKRGCHAGKRPEPREVRLRHQNLGGAPLIRTYPPGSIHLTPSRYRVRVNPLPEDVRVRLEG